MRRLKLEPLEACVLQDLLESIVSDNSVTVKAETGIQVCIVLLSRLYDEPVPINTNLIEYAIAKGWRNPMPNNNLTPVFKAEQTEAKRAEQNRRLVQAKLGEPYYKEQESALGGWGLGEPAPASVRLGGIRELD